MHGQSTPPRPSGPGSPGPGSESRRDSHRAKPIVVAAQLVFVLRTEGEHLPLRLGGGCVRRRRIQLDGMGTVVARAPGAGVRVPDPGAEGEVVGLSHIAQRSLKDGAHREDGPTSRRSEIKRRPRLPAKLSPRPVLAVRAPSRRSGAGVAASDTLPCRCVLRTVPTSTTRYTGRPGTRRC